MTKLNKLFILLAFFGLSIGTNAQTYNLGDIAVINNVIANNGLDWTPAPSDGSSVPSDWLNYLCQWSSGVVNKRIIFLNLSNNTLIGTLNLSGLDKLEVLYCRNNQLTALNVLGLGNLQTLYCEKNRLTTLDVSGLGKLWVLHCQENQLNELNVSKGLNNLEYLCCDKNKLTILDVSKLSKLQTLYCNENLLTALEVSKLSNLQTLYCNKNKLPKLDVLANSNLWALSCSDNQLTVLDILNLGNLEGIDCSNNQLTTLNMSGLDNLLTLKCSENQLTELEVSKFGNLRDVICSDNRLTTLNVSGLDYLTLFECYYNQLTALDLTDINLTTFVGCAFQAPTLTLTGTDNDYSCAIALNNPSMLAVGLSYDNGVLTSKSNTILSSPFVVGTGNPTYTLSGTLSLVYSLVSSISEIKNTSAHPIGYYNILGAKLDKEPQSGIYIIVFDNGTTKKVMK